MPQLSYILNGYKKFREARLDFNLVPLEASPSIPIPILKQNNPYLSILYYLGRRLKGKEKIQIYRPISKIILDPAKVRIVYFNDYRLKDDFPDADWNKPVGEFPHESIATMKLEEYMQKKYELIHKYEQVVNALEGTLVDPTWKSDFKNQFYNLCSPCLVEFMKKDNPIFFKWMDS